MNSPSPVFPPPRFLDRQLLHGGDYNPDQWLHAPEIVQEDLRLMRLAGCNAMSVGIFAWSALEPEEGRFTFDWLDRTMDGLASAGLHVLLSTPSGARPAWMAQNYPEVLRMDPDRGKRLYGTRHNHCMTSPVYRRKCGEINALLAERYRNHPALLIWHVSNEYGGECHCPLCQEAFRQWLRNRYGTLDCLNHAWWTSFWSHTYTDWSQIESPCPKGEHSLHGLNLDWKRYTTDQTVDFMKQEIAPLRKITPEIPVTTNFMGFYPHLNYWKFAPELDVVSWDAYPEWGQPGRNLHHAAQAAFTHDLNRSLKNGRPFLLMESTPSNVNWREICKLKKPGMHRLASLQAVAHGADSVLYFQWRKSRGSSEKFHGAVVDHAGHEKTRVFREVAEVGGLLAKLGEAAGTGRHVETALVFDWENLWAIEDAKGPRRKMGYVESCEAHYRALWNLSIPADVISMDGDFSKYRVVISPMLYMLRPGVAERLAAFVKAGGTLVCTYWSGIVNESDLCFLGGFPGPLREVLGIWSEEIDALYDGETNRAVLKEGNSLGLSGSYEARELCDLIHAETAQVLAVYGSDFYAGRPLLTENRFGQGKAFYLAARLEDRFLDDFSSALSRQLQLQIPLNTKLPRGLSVQARNNGTDEFIFVMNFLSEDLRLDLGNGLMEDLLLGERVKGQIQIPALATRVFRRPVGRAG